MNRDQALRQATQSVCGAWIKDFRDGKLMAPEGVTPEQQLAAIIERRKPQIMELFQEIMAGPKKGAICSECRAPATTRMNGRDYCSAHAHRHRQPLPQHLGVPA